ncbi:MAG: neutral/alkaline non-lysosomal ceramidase N-terminal domain-containing protein [Clostridia bacterium]|nr:neutral/alkaline non-lysosomal ceramidase N-terminal domain-containing protein [Clostridia bacterium]
MKTGYCKLCINPPYDFPMLGYYVPRKVKGVHDDLFTRAIAFSDGDKKAVVIALDVAELPQAIYDRIKDAVYKDAGVEKSGIFINCSHTHTGPVIGKDLGTSSESTPEYETFLVNTARDAAVYAFQDLKDSEFSVAKTKAEGVSFVRRYRMKDGSVATNPGVKNPNIDYPLGIPDETVRIVKIKRDGGEDILIVNFGTHPDSVGGEYISADYMGVVCKTLENALGNTKCAFLLGCQGDVNHVNVNPTSEEEAISVIDFDSVPRSFAHAEYMGRKIAGAVLSVISVCKSVKADKIDYITTTINLPSNQENDKLDKARYIYDMFKAGRSNELPYKEMALTTAVARAKRIITLENGPDSYPFNFSAIKLGDLVFAGIGGEPFTEIGTRICANSPFKETILCCLTNTAGGYIPTSKSYDEGGYEAGTTVIKKGGDDIMVNGMVKMLNELYNK